MICQGEGVYILFKIKIIKYLQNIFVIQNRLCKEVDYFRFKQDIDPFALTDHYLRTSTINGKKITFISCIIETVLLKKFETSRQINQF
jgi:hypothetical protein